MGKNKDKNKDKSKNGDSKPSADKVPENKASAASSSSDVEKAASTSAASAAPATPRVHKEILDQFLDNAAKAKKFIARAHRSTLVWTSDTSVAEDLRSDLKSMKQVLEEVGPRLDDILISIAGLKTKGFKPATAPRGPRFSIGQKVRVDSEWMESHLESGFYTKEELLDMTIVKIAEKKVLVETIGGNRIAFQMGHLEPVDSDDSSDDAGDDEPFSAGSSGESSATATA